MRMMNPALPSCPVRPAPYPLNDLTPLPSFPLMTCLLKLHPLHPSTNPLMHAPCLIHCLNHCRRTAGKPHRWTLPTFLLPTLLLPSDAAVPFLHCAALPLFGTSLAGMLLLLAGMLLAACCCCLLLAVAVSACCLLLAAYCCCLLRAACCVLLAACCLLLAACCYCCCCYCCYSAAMCAWVCLGV